MDPKTLEVLEYRKILDRVAKFASFSAGRQAVSALEPPDRSGEPATDLGEVRRRLRLTTEARRLLEIKPNFSLAEARDVRDLVHRAALGGILTPQDLLDIIGAERCARMTASTIQRLKRELPLLAQIAAGIKSHKSLEGEIARCINDHGEVLDSASPELVHMRHSIKVAHDRLLNRLNELLRSEAYRHILQEPLITLRDGRYVLPVKAELKGHLPGVVHDRSASGLTLFIEPLETLELNNQWRELQLEEGQEIDRILRRLSILVGDLEGEIVANVEALADIDLVLAKAHYANSIEAVEPETCSTGAPEDSCYTLLINARHPLLTGQVVPITVPLGHTYSALVITGPNTGGKTVALKTIGLLTLMAQAGLHIPCGEGSRVRVYRGVYADIGEEQSIEQSLSTFSSHMTQIVAILRSADKDSLVLLDELGAGTDPGEGSALARAILGHLLELGATAVVTSHHPEMKTFAQLTPGVENASVEFDLETLAPTYKLTVGLPGQSNALAIAARLGLDAAIISKARELVSPSQLEVEGLLERIRQERQVAARATQASEQALEEVAKLKDQLAKELAQIEEEHQDILEGARATALEEVSKAREEIRRIIGSLQTEHPGVEKLKDASTALQAIERDVKLALPLPAGPAGPSGLKVGDMVWVEGIEQVGQLCSLPDEEGEAEVLVGTIRARVKASALKAAGKVKTPVGKAQTSYVRVMRESRPAVKPEIDLHGCKADEVESKLETYLNDAYLARLPRIRILHGKGTGVLRQAVRDYLARHPLINSFRPGEPRDGGEGVTVATLAL